MFFFVVLFGTECEILRNLLCEFEKQTWLCLCSQHKLDYMVSTIRPVQMVSVRVVNISFCSIVGVSSENTRK
jgi:hypothetical protein